MAELSTQEVYTGFVAVHDIGVDYEIMNVPIGAISDAEPKWGDVPGQQFFRKPSPKYVHAPMHETRVGVVPEDTLAPLMHLGVQSTLRAPGGKGFVASKTEIGLTDETANADYEELPPKMKLRYENVSHMLRRFLGDYMYEQQERPPAALFAKSTEYLHRGFLHDDRIYVDCDYDQPNDESNFLSRLPRVRGDTAVEPMCQIREEAQPSLGKAYEPIFNLGIVALNRPDVFPWVKRNFYPIDPTEPVVTYPAYQNLPLPRQVQALLQTSGFTAAYERGIGAINRVALKTGHQTELMTALLAPPPRGGGEWE